MIKRVGLLLPSSNTVMEVDFYRNLPPSFTVHTSRMYMESTTVEGEELMLDVHAIPAAKVLGTAKPDVVVFGCTSAGALRGNAFDAEICRRISEVTGQPTISVIESVSHELRAISARTVAVLTPYVDELNERIKASLEADGIRVVAMHGMGITYNFDIAKVQPRQIVEFATQRLGARPPADSLFFSCTNYQAVSALPLLREVYDLPVVTSNQAALRAVCRALSTEPIGGGLATVRATGPREVRRA
ncbi:MAG: aspartate/glutamate racemase family protein [Deltaproteobacteria bacterium]|nr:aspartate/glutamate racemase family protein [Deltaproteobacteria bacterium]